MLRLGRFLAAVAACPAACLAACLAGGLAGCQTQTSHRSPTFAGADAPSPTLLTGAVECLEKADVAAGGQLVRRATDFGTYTVQKLNLRVARVGDSAPALPSSNCAELTSEHATSVADWHSPPMPKVLFELIAISGAESAFVPVVTTRMECGKKPGAWIWGTPAYESETGDVDCHEAEIALIGYLFDKNGALLWKAVHRYQVDEPPDAAVLAEELVRQAPLGKPAPLRPGGRRPVSEEGPIPGEEDTPPTDEPLPGEDAPPN
jgi:hypothetical protein